MDWRNFETCVYKKVYSVFPAAKILLNQKVVGQYSRAEASGKLELFSIHNCHPSSNQSTEELIEKQNNIIQQIYPRAALFAYEPIAVLNRQITLCLVRIEMLKAFEMKVYIPGGGIVVCLSMFSSDHLMLHMQEKLKQVIATASLVEYSVTNTSCP